MLAARSLPDDAARPAAPGTPLDDVELLVRAALTQGLHRSDPVVRWHLARSLRFARPGDPRSDAELALAALALGLHETDTIVRRRLAQQMRLRSEAAARMAVPDEAALRAHYARHAARWRLPARVRLTQIPFASRERAEAAHRAARGAGAGAAPHELAALAAAADPLPLPRELPLQSERELAARFGPGFARAVLALPVGGPAGPIASAYGVHYVVVHARRPAGPAPFAEVRAAVREALRAERAAAAGAAWLAGLRRRFEIPAPSAARGAVAGPAPQHAARTRDRP